VSAANLILLAHLTGEAAWTARIERTFAGAAARIAGAGRSVPMMLAALSAWHAGVQQVVIVGAEGDATREALERAVASRYVPFGVVVPLAPGGAADRISRLAPRLGAMAGVGRGTTAYVCRDFVCLAPTADPEELARLLAD
jgi:hypothetical protein